jgi:hypothetical protein
MTGCDVYWACFVLCACVLFLVFVFVLCVCARAFCSLSCAVRVCACFFLGFLFFLKSGLVERCTGASAVFVFGWDGVDAVPGEPPTHNAAVARARDIAVARQREAVVAIVVATEAIKTVLDPEELEAGALAGQRTQRASCRIAAIRKKLRLGSALSPSQLLVGHQSFYACGAAPILGWPAAQKAESRESRKQIGD